MRRFLGYILLLTPTLLWVGAVWQYEGMYRFIHIALAAVLHECGHLLAFSALGLPSPKIAPVARGVRLVAPCQLSYGEECLVAAAGPFMNLILFSLGMIWQSRVPALADFGEMNLMTALCNLVPMADMDGERILRSLLATRLSDRALYLVMRAIEWGTLFTALLLSLILYWYTGGGLYPAMLSLASLLAQDHENNKKREKQRKTKINKENKSFS